MALVQDQKAQQQTAQQVQRLMRLAGELYEQRGYAGTIQVEWMVGVYTQTSALTFERFATHLPPWEATEVYAVDDVLERDTSRLGTSLKSLILLLEERAETWDTQDLYFQLGRGDDLSDIKASRDPLLGASATLGFSLFGVVGASVGVSTTVYASRLRRWRRRVERSWPLAPHVPEWQPAYDALRSKNGGVSGVALKRLVDDSSSSSGPSDVTTPLRDLLRGLDNHGLTHCWHLADLGKDGLLDLQEFVLFAHLAGQAHQSNRLVNTSSNSHLQEDHPGLPRYLPPALVPPSARRVAPCVVSQQPVVDDVAPPTTVGATVVVVPPTNQRREETTVDV